MKYVLVHYSEIGLKGKNRAFFERKLVSNIRHALKGLGPIVKRLPGRLIVDTDGSWDEITERLQKVPGIATFSFALMVDRDMKDIKKALDELSDKGVKTFAVSTTRSDKAFRHTSQELNTILGDYLRKKYRWKVDLKTPDRTFYVELTSKEAFVFRKKLKGMGGLPVTSSGKLVSLISGGIDSPVAAYEMFKRGCEIVFVHFHNWTAQKDVVRDKVERIVRILSAYQPRTRLYMVPFENLQKHLIAKVRAKYRMIVYRRIMFEIAGMIAKKEKALGFVTGDSVGQVASQTLENIYCIYDKAGFPVFTPIAGDNKEDIVNRAERIGTYDISKLPYSDCCSFLVDKHPETKARLGDIEKIEAGIDIPSLAKKALDHAEIKEF
ncbi:MAG: tRNA 4-thiouridine(8) synthase ThiI [Candidatus Aenigmatarchaeota archaeon]|nr:MAG: tRNA 4-thiouridine(8) synthase ThiI [Candidatus Aenigmarchaeota archaeon]